MRTGTCIRCVPNRPPRVKGGRLQLVLLAINIWIYPHIIR